MILLLKVDLRYAGSRIVPPRRPLKFNFTNVRAISKGDSKQTKTRRDSNDDDEFYQLM